MCCVCIWLFALIFLRVAGDISTRAGGMELHVFYARHLAPRERLTLLDALIEAWL